MIAQENIPYTADEIKAMVKTIEELRKKYNGALEKARELMDKGYDVLMPEIFPELKKSDDERIRKEIIDFLELPHHQFAGKRDHKKWIAWLEKQGEKSTIIDIDKMVMEYSQTKDGDFGLPVNCMISAYRKGINDALSIVLNIENQGEKDPCTNCINDKDCITCENGNMKEIKATENAKKLDADKVIEWLKNTIKERAENYGVYKETRLSLPYNSIEDLINDFKEDFGL